jgi:hypothetical protein
MKEMGVVMMMNKKIKWLLISFVGVIVGGIVHITGYTTPIIDALYYYFAMMLVLSIQLIQQGDSGYAVATIILQLSAWFIFFYLIMYRFVFNMIYPRIRVVDRLKNSINYARRVMVIEGQDPRFVYMKVKFRLFPLLRWHTFKVPKPEYHNKKKIKNGVEGIEWRRMPSSIDIITDETNITWNNEDKCYQLTPDNLPRIDEDINQYRQTTVSTIKRLSNNVTEAIRGDSGLLKEKYQMGMPLPTGLLSDDDDVKRVRQKNKNEKEIDKKIDEHD